MEDFTPEKFYHPEDEYESLDAERERFEAEAAKKAGLTEAAASGTQPPDKATPAAQTKTGAASTPQPAQAQQSAAYPAAVPNAYYPVYQPIPGYPQPMQQPVQYYYPNMGYAQTPAAYPQNQPQPEQPVQTVQPYAKAPVQTPTSAQTQENVYARAAQPTQKPSKPRTPTGTKVFIIILCALLATMIVGFGAYIANTKSDKGADDKPDFSFSIGDNDDGDSKSDEDKNGEYGLNPFSFHNESDDYTDVEDTITLIADNGETQKRDDDNPESVGEPNEKAKDITLQPLPKNDDVKPSTQGAYAAVSDSVVTVVCYQDSVTDNETDITSQGSGVIISEDGYLVTNAHVIGNSRTFAVNIVMNSGDKYQAKIIGFDTWTDLAVLKIDAKDLKAVTFGDSEKISIGDDVIAVGSPGGEKFQNTLTKGVISAVDRELSVNKNVRYIQSDAAISPGSSGGPLCNMYGQVIGVTTAKAVAENFESMSFSIPSATVERIVGDLMHYGYVKGRTRIGFSGRETTSGVLVESIDSEGSLADSDIKEGDIITELDGQTITTFQDIYDVLDDHKPDDKVTVKAKRASKQK